MWNVTSVAPWSVPPRFLPASLSHIQTHTQIHIHSHLSFEGDMLRNTPKGVLHRAIARNWRVVSCTRMCTRTCTHTPF